MLHHRFGLFFLCSSPMVRARPIKFQLFGSFFACIIVVFVVCGQS